MATHREIRWPSVGSFDGRLRGDSHGRRQSLNVWAAHRASQSALALTARRSRARRQSLAMRARNRADRYIPRELLVCEPLLDSFARSPRALSCCTSKWESSLRERSRSCRRGSGGVLPSARSWRSSRSSNYLLYARMAQLRHLRDDAGADPLHPCLMHHLIAGIHGDLELVGQPPRLSPSRDQIPG